MTEHTMHWSGEGSLQAFLDSLPMDGAPLTVALPAGTIREQVVLARPNTVLQGATDGETRITSFCGAKEILEDGYKRGTFRTATLRTDADHVTLRNLTIVNEAAPTEEVGQAIALYAEGDHLLVEGCRLIGAQDTLFTAPLPPKEVEPRGFIGPKQFAPRTPGRQVYRHCEITGSIDFIFGGAAAWFEECELIIRDARRNRRPEDPCYIAAPSTPEGQRYGYVFHRCAIRSENVPEGTVYLARPWREHAKAWFVDCSADGCLHPQGYAEWSGRIAAGGVDFADDGLVSDALRLPGTRRLDSGEGLTIEAFLQEPV